jgi:signal peptidase I
MLRLFRVRGDSLTPEFHNGDFVITSKIPFLFTLPLPGQVVAFRHPAYGLMIKQVTGVDPEARTVEVQGSAPGSVDSREFGPVPLSRLVGRVIAHIRGPR